MIQTGLIPNAHNDLVTDASYDFYGLRLATCSLDQRVKVWQLDESTGSWTIEHDWKAHDAAVSKVSWAHPEFGTILATASFDRTVKIWEQTIAPDADGPAAAAAQLNGAGASPATRWVERAMLVDAKGTVRAAEFAPHHFGLKLATIASDNHLRVYECLEQPSLATWQLLEEVDVLALPAVMSAGARASALAPSVATPTPTQPPPTQDGSAVSLVAHALQHQASQSQLPGRPGLGAREADGGWCLSWCKDKYWGEVVAAGCGIDGVVKIIQISNSRRPPTLLTLIPAPTASTSSPATAEPPSAPGSTGEGGGADAGAHAKTYAVTSVAWAPSCGRSYHLLATGARDGHVRIWRVRPPAAGAGEAEELDISSAEDGAEDVGAGVGAGGAGAGAGRWSASVVGDFDDHKSAVGRVEWNLTGTILSSAGNDGRVRLWKMTAGNVWRPAGHISVEQAEERQADVDMGDGVVDD